MAVDPAILGQFNVSVNESCNDRNFLLVLLHGTYDTAATWTHENSPFSTALIDRLGGPARCKVCSLPWDGSNTDKGRYQAALKLRNLLGGLSREFPNWEIYVISHSHGGNIALRAVSDEVTAKQVSGVVTLGTPFIHFRERSSKLVEFIISALPFATYILAVLLTIGHMSPKFTTFWFVVIFVAGAALAQYVTDYFNVAIPLYFRRQRASLRAHRLFLNPKPPAILCVFTPTDEAYVGLELVGSFEKIFFGAMKISLLMFIAISCSPFCFIAFSVVMAIFGQLQNAYLNQQFNNWMTVALLAWVFSFFCILVSLFVTLVSHNLLRWRIWGFDLREAIFQCFITTINVRMYPPKIERCVLLQVDAVTQIDKSFLKKMAFYYLFRLRSKNPLDHSELLRKSETQTGIGDWILNR